MNKEAAFGGFSINLILDEEGDWVAHFVEMPSISAFGEEPEEAIAELRIAWSAYKESCGHSVYDPSKSLIKSPFIYWTTLVMYAVLMWYIFIYHGFTR